MLERFTVQFLLTLLDPRLKHNSQLWDALRTLLLLYSDSEAYLKNVQSFQYSKLCDLLRNPERIRHLIQNYQQNIQRISPRNADLVQQLIHNSNCEITRYLYEVCSFILEKYQQMLEEEQIQFDSSSEESLKEVVQEPQFQSLRRFASYSEYKQVQKSQSLNRSKVTTLSLAEQQRNIQLKIQDHKRAIDTLTKESERIQSLIEKESRQRVSMKVNKILNNLHT